MTPAKVLADQLEELEAVRAVADVDTSDLESATAELARCAAEALSCEIGAVYLAAGDRLAVADRGWTLQTPPEQIAAVLAGMLAETHFPFCVQDAGVVPLPSPLSDEPGIRSYYLVELTGLARGVLLVAHTDAAPRGFTQLCRRLGLRLGDAASAQLGVALTREWCRDEAARLNAAFGGSTPPERRQAGNRLQCPSETTSTVPSTTLIAVSSSIA